MAYSANHDCFVVSFHFFFLRRVTDVIRLEFARICTQTQSHTREVSLRDFCPYGQYIHKEAQQRQQFYE